MLVKLTLFTAVLPVQHPNQNAVYFHAEKYSDIPASL